MKKAIMCILSLVFVILLAACNYFDEDTLTTEYGDTFNISFDSFKMKTLITDEKSGFYFIVNDKVTKDDFEASTDSQGVVRYKVKDVTVAKKDDGFEIVEEDSSYEDTNISSASSYQDADQENNTAIIYDAVWSEIEKLCKDKTFSKYTKEEKMDYLIPIFEDFIEKGYITEYHFNMNSHPAMADFDFSCGGKGAVQLEEYYKDEN